MVSGGVGWVQGGLGGFRGGWVVSGGVGWVQGASEVWKIQGVFGNVLEDSWRDFLEKKKVQGKNMA